MNEIPDTTAEVDDPAIYLLLDQVTGFASGNNVLNEISMEIVRGQHWAILGPSGSGKTSLLNLLAGQLQIKAGKIGGSQGEIFGSSVWMHQVALVNTKHGFKTNDGVTGFYYQQRFNAGDKTDTITVAEFLQRSIERYGAEKNDLDHLNEYLQTDRLKNKLLIQLSSGETRRLLITIALLKRPKLLLLDMPLTGLDTEGKTAFDLLLKELSEKDCTVIMTSIASQVPSNISTVAILDKGSFSAVCARKDFNPEAFSSSENASLNSILLHSLLNNTPSPGFREIVRMKNVSIRYGDVTIFNNLNWLVKSGEKWALVGENGSGKSTLLSLINADHPQAYANDINLFDRKRGTGESIWDIKKNTGFVSAELFQYFPADQTCSQVIESGFYDTIGLFRPVGQVYAAKIAAWMDLANISGYARQLFRQVPAGVQRMVLLIRALIKNPPLLLLDEPAQGLDDLQQQRLKSIVTEICTNPAITLIYVTHQFTELPDGIAKMIRLTRGMPEQITDIAGSRR